MLCHGRVHSSTTPPLLALLHGNAWCRKRIKTSVLFPLKLQNCAGCWVSDWWSLYKLLLSSSFSGCWEFLTPGGGCMRRWGKWKALLNTMYHWEFYGSTPNTSGHGHRWVASTSPKLDHFNQTPASLLCRGCLGYSFHGITVSRRGRGSSQRICK